MKSFGTRVPGKTRKFSELQNSYDSADRALVPDKIGNRSYGFDPASGLVKGPDAAPGAGLKKPQSPAQQAAVKKAGLMSGAKRRRLSGKF